MNTSTYFSWSTKKTTIQLHISKRSFNSWFVSNTNTTVSMLTANRFQFAQKMRNCYSVFITSPHRSLLPRTARRLTLPGCRTAAERPASLCRWRPLPPTGRCLRGSPGRKRHWSSAGMTQRQAAWAQRWHRLICAAEVPLFVFPAVPVRIQSNSVHCYTTQEQILHLYFKFSAHSISRYFITFS